MINEAMLTELGLLTNEATRAIFTFPPRFPLTPQLPRRRSLLGRLSFKRLRRAEAWREAARLVD